MSAQTTPAVVRTVTPLQEKLTTARRNYAYLVQQLRGLELDPDEYEDAMLEATYGLQRRVRSIMETEL